MRVNGELLTSEARAQARAPFHKNEGRPWDLHEMSLYVQQGYEAIEQDAETRGMLDKGLQNLREGQKHG